MGWSRSRKQGIGGEDAGRENLLSVVTEASSLGECGERGVEAEGVPVLPAYGLVGSMCHWAGAPSATGRTG